MIVRWARRAFGDLQRVVEHIAGDNTPATADFLAAAVIARLFTRK